jgi:hypothetical protein
VNRNPFHVASNQNDPFASGTVPVANLVRYSSIVAELYTWSAEVFNPVSSAFNFLITHRYNRIIVAKL